MAAVSRARLINQQIGGVVFLPWDVDQIDEEWLAVFYGLNDLTAMKKNYTEFENKLQERRKSNPTYRKYLS